MEGWQNPLGRKEEQKEEKEVEEQQDDDDDDDNDEEEEVGVARRRGRQAGGRERARKGGGGMDARGLREESAKERGRYRERRLQGNVDVSVHADAELASALA